MDLKDVWDGGPDASWVVGEVSTDNGASHGFIARSMTDGWDVAPIIMMEPGGVR